MGQSRFQPQMIIFDVDGVLLSEERCFDATALTVWELLTSPRYLNLPSTIPFTTDVEEPLIQQIRGHILAEERILYAFKRKGLNSNWQMVYLLSGYYLLQWLDTQIEAGRLERGWVASWLQEPISEGRIQQLRAAVEPHDSSELSPSAQFTFPTCLEAERYLAWLESCSDASLHDGTCLDDLAQTQLGITLSTFSETETLWQLGHDLFQEWYLGETYTRQLGDPLRQEGKAGFLHLEIPLLPEAELQALFRQLHQAGFSLGVATGRPALETEVPLTSLGVYQYLDGERVATADDVMRAEGALGGKLRLAKPHPYSYLQAIRSQQIAPERIVEECETSLPLSTGQQYLIVGDSIADALAARELGVPFAGVYTGMDESRRKEAFKELGAVVLLERVDQLLSFLKQS